MCKLTDDKGICQRLFKKPWNRFTEDVQGALEKNIVSFKQNVRVINKTTNKYQRFDKNDLTVSSLKPSKKIMQRQESGGNWAIRKPLHKETVFAKVSLRKEKTVSLKEALNNWTHIVDRGLKNEIRGLISMYGKFDMEAIVAYFKGRGYKFRDTDVSRVEVYYFDHNNSASRKILDASFNEKKIKNAVADTGIQKILLNHLYVKGKDPELAFSPEGIEEMNLKIRELNDGKFHQPIYKVRVYESMGNKFPVGGTKDKKNKYVEAAQGTNLFFAIYQSEDGERQYETIPLNVAIERQKQGLRPVPEKKIMENGMMCRLLFILSPYDLVYLPTEEERKNPTICCIDTIVGTHVSRIYKFVDGSGSMANFIPYSVSAVIFSIPKERAIEYSRGDKLIQNEFGVGSPQSKNQKAITGELIKAYCWKISVDRLGNIIGIEGVEAKG
jgi:CRISPR-associated endonuclease Csn1